jgi:hypothetical protein
MIDIILLCVYKQRHSRLESIVYSVAIARPSVLLPALLHTALLWHHRGVEFQVPGWPCPSNTAFVRVSTVSCVSPRHLLMTIWYQQATVHLSLQQR